MSVRCWRPAAALLAASCIAASARAAECRFERTLAVDANSTLDAASGSGEIKVVPGDNAHVHVSGIVRASNGWLSGSGQADVQRVCNEPPVEGGGGSVRVGQRHEDWMHNVSISYVIEVPRAFTVNARSGSGGLDLQDLSGAVTGNTGSGSIRASQLRGAKLNSSSGSIDAENLSGDTRLGSSSGNIRARFSETASVDASASSGSVHLENVNGAVHAHVSSGDVDISGKPMGPWDVHASSGSVHLHTPGGSNFQLRANASSGSINTALPLNSQNREGRHSLEAQVGSGGPEVRVETSSGSIHID